MNIKAALVTLAILIGIFFIWLILISLEPPTAKAVILGVVIIMSLVLVWCIYQVVSSFFD